MTPELMATVARATLYRSALVASWSRPGMDAFPRATATASAYRRSKPAFSRSWVVDRLSNDVVTGGFYRYRSMVRCERPSYGSVAGGRSDSGPWTMRRECVRKLTQRCRDAASSCQFAPETSACKSRRTASVHAARRALTMWTDGQITAMPTSETRRDAGRRAAR